jgi:hypothetical protein
MAAVPLILGFLVLAILIWWHGEKARKARQLALARWAQERGMHFETDQVSSIEQRFGHFPCFTQGSNRYGYNVMRGSLGERDLWAFDYHYETYSTDSKGRRTTHHHHFSALALDTGLLFKGLTIRPESWWDKVTEFFGFDDIDFESAEFSRAFHVTSKDKRYAYDLVSQDTMEFLLESPRFTLECRAPHLLVRRSSTFGAHEFTQALELAEGFLARIPKDIQAALRVGGG